MDEDLRRRIDSLPEQPGVYEFLDRRGRVIYVGKAVDLRSRVRQYFTQGDERPMIPLLVEEAADVEVVLVETEKDALILENTLIKKHQPRFNAQLRDDKNFLHLRLDPRQTWPRFTLVRQIAKDGARYFGPYHSASQARQTLDTLQRNFPLRSCSDAVLKRRSRPCLLHQLGRCLAPCAGRATSETYNQVMEEAALFLKGRNREVVDRLRARMLREAEAERFEEAARLRDLVAAVERTVQQQEVVDPRLGDRDAWALYREGASGVAVVLPVRRGLMQDPLEVRFEAAVEDGSLLSSLLNQHYDPGVGTWADTLVPPEILLPTPPPDRGAIEELLSERRGRRVRLQVPERGARRRLVELAARNARERFQGGGWRPRHLQEALESVARVCRLESPPRRIECFDNSNLHGEDPVSAMVVFVDGRPDRRAYRRYRVRSVEGPDDFATMREVLQRRFRRAAEDGIFPDLVVVDGGRGQVTAARAALTELGVADQPVVGLAKPPATRPADPPPSSDPPAVDRIILPQVRDPIRLRANHPALRLLQHLRDESHRVAVGFHRSVRNRRQLGSVLDAIPGVGPARRRALLRHLGSARRILEASPEAIAGTPGIGPRTADAIHRALHPLDLVEEE